MLQRAAQSGILYSYCFGHPLYSLFHFLVCLWHWAQQCSVPTSLLAPEAFPERLRKTPVLEPRLASLPSPIPASCLMSFESRNVPQGNAIAAVGNYVGGLLVVPVIVLHFSERMADGTISICRVTG